MRRRTKFNHGSRLNFIDRACGPADKWAKRGRSLADSPWPMAWAVTAALTVLTGLAIMFAAGCDAAPRNSVTDVTEVEPQAAVTLAPAIDPADAARLPLAAANLQRNIDRSPEATQRILNMFGLASAPPIQWRTLSALDCDDSSGWTNGPSCSDGGWSTAPGSPVVVALQPGELLHQTALAHEYCHVRAYVLTGDPDQAHTGDCFVPGGRVDLANDALTEMGL